ncbi:MAG: class I SAM-dependent methyltransferase [candidate division KSB1 bacterium]|nr:class I SAM-dependent methyltransferase [candidate division KSB1 bacterium]
MAVVILKAGREKSVRRRHPWIFSGAIQTADADIQNGATVEVLSASGQWLCRGAYSAHSQIRVRVWSYDADEMVDAQFFRYRIQRASEVRTKLMRSEPTTAFRLVNAEADGLPGIVVDRYDDYLICQFLSAGAEFWKETLVAALVDLFSPAGIYERSEVSVRQKEGLSPMVGVLWGQEPPDLVKIEEQGLHFYVDVKMGHKTGFYLDQRENRQMVAEFAAGQRVLNCFAYTGGFGIWAMTAGAASVANIESSGSALAVVQKNLELNSIDQSKVENIEGDVFQVLRCFLDSGRRFDLIILDPPKFAESANQIPKASRGYKDINLLALKLLSPMGVLFTFSCSGHISPELFQKIVADAALDAGRQVQLIRYLSQAADHPVALNFPEGRYLKGLICRVLD